MIYRTIFGRRPSRFRADNRKRNVNRNISKRCKTLFRWSRLDSDQRRVQLLYTITAERLKSKISLPGRPNKTKIFVKTFLKKFH